MHFDRRELLFRGSFLAAASRLAPAALAASSKIEPGFTALKDDFPVAREHTYLNNAGWHPLNVHGLRAMQQYLEQKSKGPEIPDSRPQQVKELFARLINAKPSEIAFVPSTQAGENVVNSGLAVLHSGGNVVTDDLHFEGSTYLYRMLEKQGLDLRVVRHRDGRIDLRDVEKVVDRKTRLIAVSLVSYVNGFMYDARRLSDLAHAHGAYVYADIVQAAGAAPLDVRAMDLDFCACASYKWLMGDMGIGYLYVKEELQDKVLRSTQFGWRQYHNFEHHIFPYDSPSPEPATWTRTPGAGGYYEVGTVASICAACQSASLEFIHKIGVENIRAHAKPLTDRLKKELPGRGYPLLTPEESAAHIATFVVKDPEKVAAKLKRLDVTVKIVEHQMRISPSVYNDQKDIDRLLEALA